MPSRNKPYIEGRYYHVYNRSVESKRIFHNPNDYYRFMSCMNYYRNYIGPFSSMFKIDYKKSWEFLSTNEEKIDRIKDNRVEILNYCVMPNHYHLLINELRKDGIKDYIHNIQLSYSKYYNIKRNRTGPLWGGPYKQKTIYSIKQYNTLVKYIHENPQKSSRVNVSKANRYQFKYSSLTNPI